MPNTQNLSHKAGEDRKTLALTYMLQALEILDVEDMNAACHLSLAIEAAGGEVPSPTNARD